MFIGLLHANKKVGKPAKCKQCKEPIDVGELHALVMTRFGKVQESVKNLRATQESTKRDQFEEPTGRRIGKREGLRYSRLHVACLAKWLIVYHLYKSEWRKEHRKGGRPEGTGTLHQLSDETRLLRRRLVRRRAELYRQVLATDNDTRLEQLTQMILTLAREIESTGVKVVDKMSRRDGQRTKAIHGKLRRFLP